MIISENLLHKCIRCQSTHINDIFKIKFGLHDWLLCHECSERFDEWVKDKNADHGGGWDKEYFKRKYG